jgi:hypothetical protein
MELLEVLTDLGHGQAEIDTKIWNMPLLEARFQGRRLVKSAWVYFPS